MALIKEGGTPILYQPQVLLGPDLVFIYFAGRVPDIPWQFESLDKTRDSRNLHMFMFPFEYYAWFDSTYKSK